MKSGVYKITNPKCRIYIGQSRNIKSRFSQYKNICYSLKRQPKLLRSFKKYGVCNHKFEVIVICDIDLLSPIEYYFQEYYNSIDTGLNCVYEHPKGNTGFFSDESKRKMSLAKKGVYDGIKNPMYGKVGHLSPNYGRKHTEETKNKIGKANKGKIVSKETCRKISESKKGTPSHNKGKKLSKEQIEYLIKINTGRKASVETRRKMSETRLGKKILNKNPPDQWGSKNPNAKKIINTKTLEIIGCCTEICNKLNIKPDTFRKYLSGKLRNKTDYEYLENYNNSKD